MASCHLKGKIQRNLVNQKHCRKPFKSSRTRCASKQTTQNARFIPQDHPRPRSVMVRGGTPGSGDSLKDLKKNFESCPRACGPLRPGVEREGCSADSTCRAPPASFFENDGRRWGGTGYVRRSPCRPEGGNNFRSSSGVGDEARDSTSKED